MAAYKKERIKSTLYCHYDTPLTRAIIERSSQLRLRIVTEHE